MLRPRPALIERLTDHPNRGGETLAYFVRPGSRSRPYIWFDPHEVPPFEGPSATFDIQRTAGRWQVVGASTIPMPEL